MKMKISYNISQCICIWMCICISLCISLCIILLFVCVLVCVCLPASLKAGKWWQTGPTSLQGHSIEMPLKSALCWHILSAVLLNWQLELFGVGWKTFWFQEFGWFAQILFTIRWNSKRFTKTFFKSLIGNELYGEGWKILLSRWTFE